MTEHPNLTKVRRELAMYKQRTRILTDICDRFQTEISDLEQRMENLELSGCKRMVIITGLALAATKKSDMIDEITDFIDQALNLQCNVEDVFTLGGNNPKPVIVSFQTYKEKSLVLKHKARLSRLSVSVYINDYVPAATTGEKEKEKTK